MSLRASFNALWRRSDVNGDGVARTYLHRWTLLRLPGARRLYLHHFVGDDWSVDPHDHPKRFVSIGLWGGYDEDVFDPDEGRVVQTVKWRAPWFRIFPPSHTHRVRSRHLGGAWTLVYVGPRRQDWGFWLRGEDWVEQRQYLRDHATDRVAASERLDA